MKDSEVWLILANGLATRDHTPQYIAVFADELLVEYKKRFDPDYFKGANDE